MDGCLNGHEPEDLEIRPSGARVCMKCKNAYHSRTRRFDVTNKPPRKANNTDDRSKR